VISLFEVYIFVLLSAHCNSYGCSAVPSPPVKVRAEVPDFR